MSPAMRVSPSSSRVARRRPLTTTYMAAALSPSRKRISPAASPFQRTEGRSFPPTGFEAAEFLVENFAQEGGVGFWQARADIHLERF